MILKSVLFVSHDSSENSGCLDLYHGWDQWPIINHEETVQSLKISISFLQWQQKAQNVHLENKIFAAVSMLVSFHEFCLSHMKNIPGDIFHLLSRRLLGTWSYAKCVSELLQEGGVELELSEKVTANIYLVQRLLKVKIFSRSLPSCIYSSGKKRGWPKSSSLVIPSHHEAVLCAKVYRQL